MAETLQAPLDAKQLILEKAKILEQAQRLAQEQQLTPQAQSAYPGLTFSPGITQEQLAERAKEAEVPEKSDSSSLLNIATMNMGTPEGRAAATIAIPSLFSAAGTSVGAAVGNVPGAIATEAIFDTLGYGANIALGLEPFSWDQLVLSLTTPLISRSAVNAGYVAVKKGTAFNYAIQQRAARAAEKIKEGFQQARRGFTISDSSLAQAIREHSNTIKDFIEAQGQKSLLSFNRLKHSFPVPSHSVTTALYEKANEITTDLPADFFRAGKQALQEEILKVETWQPGLVPDLIKKMAQMPDSEKLIRSRVAQAIREYREAGHTITAEIRQSFRQMIEQEVHDEFSTISFQEIRELLTAFGLKAQGLADTLHSNPEARETLYYVNKIRDSLVATLDAGTQSNLLTTAERNALRLANKAYHRMRTMEELTYFTSKFTEGIGSDEVLNAPKMLEALLDPRNQEAVQLVKNLQQEGWYGRLRRTLGQLNRHSKTFEKELVQQGRYGQRLKSLEERVERRGIEIEGRIAAMQPPFTGERIVPPNMQTPIRLAFSAASIGAAISQASGMDTNFDKLSAFAAGATLPIILTGAMTSRSGQEFLLKHMTSSNGHLTPSIAGAMGAFLRASGAVIFEQSAQERQEPQSAPLLPEHQR